MPIQPRNVLHSLISLFQIYRMLLLSIEKKRVSKFDKLVCLACQMRTNKYLYGCAVGSPLLDASWIEASISALECLPYHQWVFQGLTKAQILSRQDPRWFSNSNHSSTKLRSTALQFLQLSDWFHTFHTLAYANFVQIDPQSFCLCAFVIFIPKFPEYRSKRCNFMWSIFRAEDDWCSPVTNFVILQNVPERERVVNLLMWMQKQMQSCDNKFMRVALVSAGISSSKQEDAVPKQRTGVVVFWGAVNAVLCSLVSSFSSTASRTSSRRCRPWLRYVWKGKGWLYGVCALEGKIRWA